MIVFQSLKNKNISFHEYRNVHVPNQMHKAGHKHLHLRGSPEWTHPHTATGARILTPPTASAQRSFPWQRSRRPCSGTSGAGRTVPWSTLSSMETKQNSDLSINLYISTLIQFSHDKLFNWIFDFEKNYAKLNFSAGVISRGLRNYSTKLFKKFADQYKIIIICFDQLFYISLKLRCIYHLPCP